MRLALCNTISCLVTNIKVLLHIRYLQNIPYQNHIDFYFSLQFQNMSISQDIFGNFVSKQACLNMNNLYQCLIIRIILYDCKSAMLLPILSGYLVSYAATNISRMPRNQIMEYWQYSMLKISPILIHIRIWYVTWQSCMYCKEYLNLLVKLQSKQILYCTCNYFWYLNA